MKSITFIVFSAAFFLAVSCKGTDTGIDASSEQRIQAGPAELSDVISRIGTVRPEVKIDLKSEAAGRIEKVMVKEGQHVSAGDTIIVIDPSRLENHRRKFELGLRRAKLDKQIAERDYNNGKKLMQTGTISERKLQDLRIANELASLNYEQKLIELKDIDEQLGKTVVTSPINGVVTDLFVKEGEIAVSATSGLGDGTPIGTVSDIKRLEIVTSVGEVDYVHLKTGQKAVIRSEAAFGSKTTGTIRFISMSAKSNSSDELGSFAVRVSVDSTFAGLVPGINVVVDFPVLDKKVDIAVPYHFVINENGTQYVNVSETDFDGRESVRKRVVETGSTDYRFYEILSGLQDGETVVYRREY